MLRALVVALIVTPFCVRAADSDCAALLKDGLYDTSSVTSRVSQVSTAIQHLCMSTAQTAAEARAVGASVGVPDLPVVLGWNEGTNSFAQFKLELCSDYFSKNQSFTGMDQALKRVTDNAPAIINACNGVTGIRGYITKNFPPDENFIVVVDYLQSAGAPRKTKVTVEPMSGTCSKPKEINAQATVNFLCKLGAGSTSTLLAIDVQPQVAMPVPTLRYTTILPTLPQRTTDRVADVESQVVVSAALNTGGPGPTKVVVEGWFAMMGTSPGPSSVLTISLDGVPQTSCRPQISGQDNYQGGKDAGRYHCEFDRYLATGRVEIRAQQVANNGNPSKVVMTATAVPTEIRASTLNLATTLKSLPASR